MNFCINVYLDYVAFKPVCHSITITCKILYACNSIQHRSLLLKLYWNKMFTTSQILTRTKKGLNPK